jgi:hypothetical protein
MRRAIRIGMLLVAATWCARGIAGEPRLPLKIMYLGNEGTPRAAQFVEFLRAQFERVEAADRDTFDPQTARDADVVLLDWSQRDTDSENAVSPLGPRENWSKPTVLVGSAGHLLAAPWEIIGGSG